MAAPTGYRCFLPAVKYLQGSFKFSKDYLKTKNTPYYYLQHYKSLALWTSNFQHATHICYSQTSNDKAKSAGKPPLKKPYTPVGKHDGLTEKHRDAEKEPLEAFPDDINPVTGEKGGPKGPEPTRYGDWERKGRCVDF